MAKRRKTEVVMAEAAAAGAAPRPQGVDLGEVVVERPGEALPPWAFEPGTLIGLSLNGVGDFGIVRSGAEPGYVVLSSIGTRTKRVHRLEVLRAVRPMVLIPKPVT